jgi:transcriptional regulator with XRE-family HTH domain
MTFKERRIRCALSQEDIARELHVTIDTVSKWECGRSSPTITQRRKLAILLDLTLDELFALFPPKPRRQRLRSRLGAARTALI